MISRNDPCWCGSGSKWKKCHAPDPGEETDFDRLKRKYKKKYQIYLKTPKEIEGIKKACRLTADILDATCKMAKEGVTTSELNDFAQKLHEKAGAIAAPLGYGEPPFPKSICTSLNEVICHGIPDGRPLKNGDILNIDISAILNGYYGDCSRMVVIGDISEEKRRVVDVAYDCLMQSIAILKPGVCLSEIGKTIEKHAHLHDCSVVYQFVGHGVGLDFHEAPQVSHCKNRLRIPLAAGMTFTIEPMINAGVADAVIDDTEWVARTQDGRASAQWEHTILITDNSYEILTLWD